MRYRLSGATCGELENLLHRAVALTVGDTIDIPDLGLPELAFQDSGRRRRRGAADGRPSAPGAVDLAARALPAPELPDNLEAYLDSVERDILVRALERHRFNRTAAGASLGLSLRQMRYRMARLGVQAGDQPFGSDLERGDSCVTDGSSQAQAGRGIGVSRAGLRAGRTGWWSAARRIDSPNFGPRPAGIAEVDARAAALDQPAAGPLWRRRDRAPVHQPARLGRASLLPVKSAVLRCPRISSSGATASCCSSCPTDERAWHAGRSSLARPRELQRLCDRHRARRPRRREAFEPAQYRVPGPCCCARSRCAIRCSDVAGHEHVAPGRKLDPGPGFDWAAPGTSAALVGSGTLPAGGAGCRAP